MGMDLDTIDELEIGQILCLGAVASQERRKRLADLLQGIAAALMIPQSREALKVFGDLLSDLRGQEKLRFRWRQEK